MDAKKLIDSRDPYFTELKVQRLIDKKVHTGKDVWLYDCLTGDGDYLPSDLGNEPAYK